ncbi:MAG TPA: elongation factor G [Pirellulales bacterium]|jgi:elongation factor G|nr:elongation factor G [Pirellulales bacterium]
MTLRNVETIRNVAFCGHGGAGKTTLVDQLLVKTGMIKHPVSVDNGTSVCDFDEEEKHHKHTVEAKVTHFPHDGMWINALDTPGYPDFIGATIGALRAADTAAIVINAHSGIAVNTRRTFQEAGKAGLGRMIVINKMDGENIDFPALMKTITELFGQSCVPFNVPIGCGHDFRGVVNTFKLPTNTSGALLNAAEINNRLIEAIIETDEEVTARYFDGVQPTDEEIKRLMVDAVVSGGLIPIFCCSARTGVGLDELLDGIVACAVPPDKIIRKGRRANGEEVDVHEDPNEQLVAQVFKTRIDPFVQRISYIRVFSGKLKKEELVHATGARKGVKLHQLFHVQANQMEPIDDAGPGEIIAVTKNEDLHTGTELGDLLLDEIRFPTPMVGLAVTPKSRGDEGKLSGALHKIVEEDATLRLDRDAQTKELVMTGMSELHLQMIRERLKRRDKVEVETKEPKIPYRETIQFRGEGSYRHKKQSGGRGQFGEVHIRLYPMPEGTDITEFATKERFPHMREFRHDAANNFLWVDSIVGGTIPNNFLPAVEKGFRERMERGVIAGYKVQNIAAEVFFGKHHPVDSSEAAFKTAGSMAFRNVFQESKPALLEPIVTLHVTVPASKLGDINSDMSGRRGRVVGMDSAGGDLQTVTAEVPLAEVTTYARSLSSLTGGQGSFTMELSHYDVVPGNVQKEIVDKAVLAKEEEEE